MNYGSGYYNVSDNRLTIEETARRLKGQGATEETIIEATSGNTFTAWRNINDSMQALGHASLITTAYCLEGCDNSKVKQISKLSSL